MKVNAPEKMWLDSRSVFLNKPNKSGLTEYTRTDAFIENACEYWYKYNRDVVNKQCCGFTVNVEDFRKYMEDKK